MNLAVIIGLSDYKKLTPLPACANDGKEFLSFVSTVDKFHDILFIDSSLGACIAAKSKLADFIKKHKEAIIDDLVFYYSGHGDFDGNDFYFLWDDYNDNAKRQTSISNSELDNMLKSLNPKLVVKIVDACNAGLSYIKGESGIKEYFEKSKGSFKSCYFLYSSGLFQNSYASDSVSSFTACLLESFNREPGFNLRYRDIIDFIADNFKKDEGQTPFFVCQGDFTDIFCIIPDRESPLRENSEEQAVGKQASLTDRIAKKAHLFCSEGEVGQHLAKIYGLCSDHPSHLNIHKFFEISYSFSDQTSSLPKLREISKWISSQSHPYFASVQYVEEESNKPNVFGFIVNKVFNTPVSFSPSWKQEITVIKGVFAPTYPSLDKFHLYIAPVVSQDLCTIFYGVLRLTKSNWDSYIPQENKFEWQSLTYLMKMDNECTNASKCISDMTNFVVDFLEKQFSD